MPNYMLTDENGKQRTVLKTCECISEKLGLLNLHSNKKLTDMENLWNEIFDVILSTITSGEMISDEEKAVFTVSQIYNLLKVSNKQLQDKK